MSQHAAALRPAATAAVPLSRLVPGQPAIAVTGITLDSRAIVPGDLYVALPGAHTHGARFAAQAVARGAVAILTDGEGAVLVGAAAVPVAVVPDPRSALAPIAVSVYGAPAERLGLYGVTGTTGKTSTTFLIAAGLAAAGHTVGTIGTIGFRLGDRQLPSPRTTITTPEAPDLQALLAYLAEHGADAVAMEVSSHALALHRSDGLVFDVSAFTNLGRDHLDFHHDQESYFQTKARLFRDGHSRAAVVATDDAFGRRLADELTGAGSVRLVTTGAQDADYRVVSADRDATGRCRVRLATPGGEQEFVLGLLGDFNVRNATTAAAVLDLAGIDLATALPGFAAAAVPGRMQRVDLGSRGPIVVVDFAHTPEAVAAALAALPDGRRLVVLGCGGDRDRHKRGPMGAAAALGADVVIVTDDNPRSEEPSEIRAQVMAGARSAAISSGAEVIDGGDRADAIRLALSTAGSGDWVAILGKGHETGQQLRDRTIVFDDVDQVRRQWAELGGERD